MSAAYRPARRTSLTAQDPTGRWHTVESTHFNVHVREEYRELGPRAAREAEAAWAAFQELLPVPRRRIDLVVADNVDDANGFASTYPLPRIVVYAFPPAGDIQLGSYDRWLRLVIVHELAHLFHIDLAAGWWSLGRAVLGRAPFLFPNDYTPPWMREGLAVFYESRLTGAGRLGGGYLRAIVGAAVAEQGALPLDAANTPTPKWPAGLRAYAFGAAFMAHGAATAGDTAVAAFVRTVARNALPWVSLSGAWRDATGASLGAAWNASQDSARAEGRTGAGDDPVTLLVRGLRVAIPPRLSPDGRYVAMVHNDGRDATRLVVLDRAARARDSTAGLRRIARLIAPSGIAWLPDGSVLVSQLEYVDPYTLRSDLWAIAMDGTARQLTRGERLREPDAAPDGSIVAVRIVPGGSELVLVGPCAPALLRPCATFQTFIASGPGIEWASPRFNPAGDQIAAVRVQEGRHDIVLLDRTGRVLRALTNDRALDLQPAFSADGRWLMWSREIDGVPQIVGAPWSGVSTSRPQLTREPWAAWAPAPGAGDTTFYLAYHADGFALASRAGPAPQEWSDGGPDTAAAPAAAPPTELRLERPYSPFPSILPQYWMPQLFVESDGVWLGALSSGADALDRHLWSASLLGGLAALEGQYSGSVAYAYSGLRHVVVDASWSHRPELYIGAVGNGTPGIVCCDPNDQLSAGVTVIRRRARTQALVRVGLEASTDLQAERRGVSLAASVGHAVEAPLGISTQDGWRAGLSIRHRDRIGSSLVSTQVILRGSGYVSSGSGSFARQVFAVRGAVGTIAGSDPTEFSVGGVSSGAITIVPGIVLGSGARNFPVRGYPPGARIGRRVVNLTLENRVPLALVARGLGMMPLGLDRLSAALFTDAAITWSRSNCPDLGTPVTSLCQAWMWSVGAEVSADLGLGYQIPLRARGGAALRVSDEGRAGAWIAIGSAF